jgi:hypothetical protein
MATINSGQFGEICEGVWRDRAGVVTGRGVLSGEAALVRAVYWRLCKSGVMPAGAERYASEQTILAYESGVGRILEQNANPPFDGAPALKDLIERYQNEIGPAERSPGSPVS